jgi:hypothetical protein
MALKPVDLTSICKSSHRLLNVVISFTKSTSQVSCPLNRDYLIQATFT